MKIINKEDNEYSELLKEIPNAPNTLYTVGNLNNLKEKCIAVVGSRNMTEYGKNITKEIVKDLTKAGICIVSGMATGIDTVAHTTCLDNGGKTIAVLGSGLNKIFPPENLNLFKRIVNNNGLVITEYPENQIAQKQFFAIRNRIISGLCLATLVIEATYRSGTSITAQFALKQGRKLLCIPNSIGNKNSAGILNWLKKGAKLVTNANEILQEIGVESEDYNIDEMQYLAKQKNINEIELEKLKNEEEIIKKIYYYIKQNGETNAELLCNKFKTEIYKINVYLSILELKGLIKNTHGISYNISENLYV